MMILRTTGYPDINIKSVGGGETLRIYAELSANLEDIKEAIENSLVISFYAIDEKDDGSVEERLTYKEYGAWDLKKVLGQGSHIELIFERSSNEEVKALKAENRMLSDQVTALELAIVELYEGGLEE